MGSKTIETATPDTKTIHTEPTPKERGKRKRRAWLLGSLLFLVAVIGPAVTYAGVSVIWPSSTHTADVNTSPPLTLAEGSDYTTAETLGFAGSFDTSDNAAAMSLTLSGLSGGTVTVDDYAAITKGASVTSYKVEVASALSGTLSSPDTLKIRIWTGATEPTADDDAGVCAVLDLTAAADTESTDSCSASAKIQVVYELPVDATGSSDVDIRFSSIVFA